jgi:hypothetical protein
MFEVLRRSMGRHVLEPTNKSWLHQPKKVGSRNKESWKKPFESFLSNLLNLAPTLGKLGGWNLPSLIEYGDFNYFQILFLLNLEYT